MEFHGWVCDILDEPDSQWLMLPRGHLKSMMLKAKACQVLLSRPTNRSVIYSKTATLARKVLAEVKEILKQPIIRALWTWVPEPGPKERNWKESTKDYLTLAWPEEAGKPPQGRQIECFGTTGSDTGFHYDTGFFDDILDDKSITTQDQIQKVDQFWAMSKPKMEPGAPVYGAGTFYHYQDTYSRIREELGKNFHVRGIDFETCEPIYEFFTAEALKKLKDDMWTGTGSHYSFACQYALDTNPREEQIFPEPYQMYGPHHSITQLPDGDYIYRAAVDPAQTSEQYSDFTALTITATDRTKQVWVVVADQIKKDPSASAEQIIETCTKYPIRSLAVESGASAAYVTVLKYKLREWENRNRRKLGWRWEELQPSNSRTKFDRINLTLGVLVRDRKVWIHEEMRDLVLQMSLFSKNYRGHDDLVDSLAMHYMMVSDFKQDYWTRRQAEMDAMPTMTIFNIMRQAQKAQEIHSWEGHFVDSAS